MRAIEGKVTEEEKCKEQRELSTSYDHQLHRLMVYIYLETLFLV